MNGACFFIQARVVTYTMILYTNLANFHILFRCFFSLDEINTSNSDNKINILGVFNFVGIMPNSKREDRKVGSPILMPT